MVLALDPERAPVTVANMLAYANSGFYDNTLFHRVISGFMVQGGGFTSGLVPKTPSYGAIELESNNGLSNLRGTIAMAQTGVADSATSQFFVNQVDNAALNYSSAASPGYAVFGTVVSGMAVIDSMAQVRTTTVGANANPYVVDAGCRPHVGVFGGVHRKLDGAVWTRDSSPLRQTCQTHYQFTRAVEG